jgi:hypothetical protein
MEWAQAKVFIADRYFYDFKSDQISAPLVGEKYKSWENVIQNGYKQQACVYVIGQHKGQPPYKIGMDRSGLQRRLDNYRTILRKLWVYYAIGFPRDGYYGSSYAMAGENFLHWRLQRFRLKFPEYRPQGALTGKDTYSKGGGDIYKGSYADEGRNYSELFAKGITLGDIQQAVRDMLNPAVVREYYAQLPKNLRSYRIAPAWMYRVLPGKIAHVRGFATYHERRKKAAAVDSASKRKASLKGSSLVYVHNNQKWNIDPDSIDVLQQKPKLGKPGLKTKVGTVVVVNGTSDERFAFDHWPARVMAQKNKGFDLDVTYFGDDKGDDVVATEVSDLTVPLYNRLSQEAGAGLQAALDLAYEAKFKKAPPK